MLIKSLTKPTAHLRSLLLECPDVTLEKRERPHRSGRNDRSRTPTRRQHCDLANDGARPDLVPWNSVDRHLGRAGLDYEEAVTEVALCRQRLTLCNVELRRNLGYRIELLFGNAQKERDGRETRSIHSSTISAPWVVIRSR